jgi:internalin A
MSRNLFAITLACLNCAFLLPTVRAEESFSSKSELKPFVWWCQRYDSLPAATQATIRSVLREVGNVNNCQLADSKLRKTETLTIDSVYPSPQDKKHDLSPIATLTHLKKLDIKYDVRINDLSLLAGMTKLEKLKIHPGNGITDVKPLLKMSNMTNLELPGNLIVDISPFANMTKLTYLDLKGNRISNIKPLSKLTKLTSLDLSYNQISDVRSLATLEKLYSLRLENNKFTEADCPFSLVKTALGEVSICHF